MPHLAPSPLTPGAADFLGRIIATGRRDAVYPQRADPLLSSAPLRLRPLEVLSRSPGPASSRSKSLVHPWRCTHAWAPPAAPTAGAPAAPGETPGSGRGQGTPLSLSPPTSPCLKNPHQSARGAKGNNSLIAPVLYARRGSASTARPPARGVLSSGRFSPAGGGSKRSGWKHLLKATETALLCAALGKAGKGYLFSHQAAEASISPWPLLLELS